MSAGDWGWVEATQRVSPSDTALSAFWGTFLNNDSTGGSVKGSWHQLVAAAPYDVCGMIAVFRTTDQAVTALVDLGVGAAAAEQVLVPNLHFRRGSSNDIATHLFLPVRVANGERIAGRFSFDDGSNFAANVRVRLHLMAATINLPSVQSRAATYGANTTTSKGTVIDPGSTSYTRSAWVEIATTTDFDANHLLVTINEGGTALTTTPTTTNMFFDVAIGASGSEQVIVSDYHCGIYTGIRSDINRIGLPVSIPAGSRIAIRMASGDTSSTTRPKEFSVTIFG